MTEARTTYVIQRLRLRRNGEAHAEGWRDWSIPHKHEATARELLAGSQGIARQLRTPVQYRLVKIEETREVIA